MLSASALEKIMFPSAAEIASNAEANEVWTKFQKVRFDVEKLPSGSVKSVLVYDINRNILPLINQSFKLRDWAKFPATWAREYKSLMQMLYNIEQQLSAQTNAPTTVQRPPVQPTVTTPITGDGEGSFVDIFKDPQTGLTVDELLGLKPRVDAAPVKKSFAFDNKILIMIATAALVGYAVWASKKKGR